MISQNCKYSYYGEKEVPISHNRVWIETFTPWEEIKELFNTKIINSIIGYKDGLLVTTKASFLVDTNNRPLSQSGTFICKYNPAMIRELFGISSGLDDILNSHIGYECKSAEQAEIRFMAKLLGSKNE